jgi:cation diffusion facilitator family transporter
VSVAELYRRSRRAALCGIALCLLLGLAKLLGGWFGHSSALISDGIHSFGDVLTLCVVWAALHFSERPPDPEHPYGHTRIEAVAGSNVALAVMISGLVIIYEAVQTVVNGYEEPRLYTLFIAGASALVKDGLYRYQRRIAQGTGSSAIMASAWDHRLDALSSLAVMVGVAVAHWGGPRWRLADPLAALAVAGVVLCAGANLFWSSLQELMDRQADPEILDAVRREALTVSGVLGVEKLFVRKTGLEYLVDIHVEVDPSLNVREGHAIAHAVKDRVMGQLMTMKDVLVHIEPSPLKKLTEPEA